jgi:hypothetical protein
MIVTYKEDGWHVTQRSHGILAAELGANWRLKDRPERWRKRCSLLRMHVSGLPAYRHLYALNLADGSLIWNFNYVGQMGEN